METTSAIEAPYRPSLLARLRWRRKQVISWHIVANWVFRLWRWTIKKTGSNYVSHAEREFEVLNWPGDCEMQALMCQNITDLLWVFASQGHSGSSAPYCIRHFERLAHFSPISPLTGADDEWHEMGTDVFQNRRCSDVFKDGKDGEPYWSSGRVFRYSDGGCFTSRDSRVPISFPWTRPDQPEYVDVAE